MYLNKGTPNPNQNDNTNKQNPSNTNSKSQGIDHLHRQTITPEEEV